MLVRYRAALRPELIQEIHPAIFFYVACNPPASSGMRYRAALCPEQKIRNPPLDFSGQQM
jgi:hypothetical protein